MSDTPSSQPELSPLATLPQRCPRCQARMAVKRIVPSRFDFEHWTLRCTKCGNIHEAQVAIDPMKSNAQGWLSSELVPPK